MINHFQQATVTAWLFCIGVVACNSPKDAQKVPRKAAYDVEVRFSEILFKSSVFVESPLKVPSRATIYVVESPTQYPLSWQYSSEETRETLSTVSLYPAHVDPKAAYRTTILSDSSFHLCAAAFVIADPDDMASYQTVASSRCVPLVDALDVAGEGSRPVVIELDTMPDESLLSIIYKW